MNLFDSSFGFYFDKVSKDSVNLGLRLYNVLQNIASKVLNKDICKQYDKNIQIKHTFEKDIIKDTLYVMDHTRTASLI